MVVNRPEKSGWIKPILTLAIAILIGWFCVIGAREIVQSLDAGVLNNRKGPDVLLADRPLLYWSVVGFYVAIVNLKQFRLVVEPDDEGADQRPAPPKS